MEYAYKLTEVISSTMVNQSVTSRESVTIYNLIPFTDYNFQVQAYTSAGVGPFSDSLITKTLEAGKCC